MRRRELLLAATAMTVAPRCLRAQQKAMPVIGFLSSASAEPFAAYVASFRDGLKETGYIEGQNLAIEFAWADGHYEKLPDLVAGLLRRKVALIAAVGGVVTALAAKQATSTIPIVISVGEDPVQFGLVASLARPEANITGVTLFVDVLTPKRLELLGELVPRARLAILINPEGPNAVSETRSAQAAAQQLGRELRVFHASNSDEISAAFAEVGTQSGTGLVIGTDPYFSSRKDQIAELAARQQVSTVYFHRDFILAGGLLSYGASITREVRVAGLYSGRILSGAKPGDLPIWQPTRFELVINLKAAKALGLTVPPSILARADEVIE